MTVLVCRGTSFYQLRPLNKLKVNVLISSRFLLRIYVHLYRSLIDIKISIFVKEVLRSPRLPILTAIYDQRHIVVFHIGKKLEHFFKFLRPVLLIAELAGLDEYSLGVAYVTSSRSSGIVGVDAVPCLLENTLHLFQPI